MLQNRRNWTDYEDKAIIAMVKKYGTKNWAQISEKISSKYGIEYRTGKQCRQRWHNHLDPEVNKEAWSNKQQKIMFDAHQRYGNKWTEIAKLFEGRTDNDIKNHFYSMLRRSLRRVNKILGMRNSTKKIRLIKPSVLTKIFSHRKSKNAGVQHFVYKVIAQALFQFSKSKSPLDFNAIIDSNQRKRLEELIQKLAVYNEEYEASLLLKKDSKRFKDQEHNNHDLQDFPQSLEMHKFTQKKTNLKEMKKLTSKQSNKEKNQPDIQQKKLQEKNQKETLGFMTFYNNMVQNNVDSLIKKKVRKNSKKDNQQLRQEPKNISRHKNSKMSQKQQMIEEQVKDLKPLAGSMTRLRRKSSLIFNFQPEQFYVPDIFQLPELPMMERRSSSYNQQRKTGSNHFLSNSTPTMDAKLFTRTPKEPTPSMFLPRAIQSYEWTANNEDLDWIVHKTKEAINRKLK